MRKVSCIIILAIVISILTGCGALLIGSRPNYQEAQANYEEEVIAKLQEELDKLEPHVRVVVEEYHETGREDDYWKYAVLNYESDDIDEWYTKDYNSETAIDLKDRLHLVYEKICENNKTFRYSSNGKEIEIFMLRNSALHVNGKEHDYDYYEHDEKDWKGTTLYIDDEMVYLDHYSSKKSDSKKKDSSGTGGSSSGGAPGKSGSRSSKTDPYDVYEFDDGDEFADEWAEEFGDGDWEEGWDDAYEYWEENN